VGSPWRDIPERYGNWSTIYGQFHSWARKGVFQALTSILPRADGGVVIGWLPDMSRAVSGLAVA
jgi:transposase